MGELEPWIDEGFIKSVWYGMGEQVNVKMIRDKFSGCVKQIPAMQVDLADVGLEAMRDTVSSTSPALRRLQKLLLSMDSKFRTPADPSSSTGLQAADSQTEGTMRQISIQVITKNTP